MGDTVTGKATWADGSGYLIVTGTVIVNGSSVIVTNYVIHYAESESGLKIDYRNPNLLLDEYFKTEDAKYAITGKEKHTNS